MNCHKLTIRNAMSSEHWKKSARITIRLIYAHNKCIDCRFIIFAALLHNMYEYMFIDNNHSNAIESYFYALRLLIEMRWLYRLHILIGTRYIIILLRNEYAFHELWGDFLFVCTESKIEIQSWIIFFSFALWIMNYDGGKTHGQQAMYK